MVKYFVSTTGSNTNNGTSLSTPFATLAKACSVLVSGDEVEVADGIYTNQPTPAINGKNNWKLYAAAGVAPLLRFDSDFNGAYQGLDIRNCNNFSVTGLKFQGEAGSLTLSAAQSAQNASPSTFIPKYDMNGIQVSNSYLGVIKNCVAVDFPGGGIALVNTDLMTVDGCRVERCTAYSKYGCQGITYLYAFNSPGASAGRVGLKILNSEVYDCVNRIPWKTEVGGNGQINEGNGLYSDTTKRNEANTATYTGTFLYRGNTCKRNGAAGVQALNSCPGLIDRSTFEKNRLNVDTTTGEIQVNNVAVDMFENNIIVSNSSQKYFSAFGTANVSTNKFKYNTVTGTTLFDGSNVDNQLNTFL